MSVRPSGAKIAAALGVVYIVWGSTYLGIRLAIDAIPPLLMAGFRFAIAGALLIGWSLVVTPDPSDRPTRSQWRAALIIGACLPALGNGGVTVAEEHVPSGIAALIVATVPLWMALFGAITGRRLGRVQVLGVLLGLAGVGLLFRPGVAGTAEPWRLVVLMVSPLF